MSYLLDSHALLWFRYGDRRMPRQVRLLLEDVEQDVYYSVVTPWELSIKYTKGKLPLPSDFFTTLPALGFACLPVEEAHIDRLRELPALHADPFDRMLVAQARAERLILVTCDKSLAAYPIETLILSP